MSSRWYDHWQRCQSVSHQETCDLSGTDALAPQYKYKVLIKVLYSNQLLLCNLQSLEYALFQASAAWTPSASSFKSSLIPYVKCNVCVLVNPANFQRLSYQVQKKSVKTFPYAIVYIRFLMTWDWPRKNLIVLIDSAMIVVNIWIQNGKILSLVSIIVGFLVIIYYIVSIA